MGVLPGGTGRVHLGPRASRFSCFLGFSPYPANAQGSPFLQEGAGEHEGASFTLCLKGKTSDKYTPSLIQATIYFPAPFRDP